MQNPSDEAKKVLDPIVDLFTGTDGGAAFVKLRHGVLPQAFANMEHHKASAELVRHLDKVSILCSMLLNDK